MFFKNHLWIMRTKSVVVFLIICMRAAAISAQDHVVSGIIFSDRNSNGVRERNEKGIRGIPVSNGDTIIYTSKGGRFTIESSDGAGAFPILPSGYSIGGDGIGNTALKGSEQGGELAFPIVKQKKRGNFRIAAVGDVQVNDSTELSYAARTIFSELSNRRDIDFSVYLGDLVNDDMRLLPAIAEQLRLIPHMSWTVAGNHDLDKGSPRKPVSYTQTFGPPDYAFNFGNTLFIILDNVTGYGRGYTARLSERQRRFVKNCLDITPRNYNIVMCVHVPVYGSKFQNETVALFNKWERVLILSGHTHMTSRHILAPNVCELVAGASCGSWWTGELGSDAVPLAIQRCGAPRNYYTVDFSKEGYSFAFKGIGMDDHIGMDVWVQGEEHSDTSVEVLTELPAGCVIANIFGGTDITEVEMRVNGEEWRPMKYSPMPSPVSNRIIHWNKTAGYPTKYSKRTPLRKTVSPHIWSLQLPADLSNGFHNIEIRAFDQYGFETSYTRPFIKR